MILLKFLALIIGILGVLHGLGLMASRSYYVWLSQTLLTRKGKPSYETEGVIMDRWWRGVMSLVSAGIMLWIYWIFQQGF